MPFPDFLQQMLDDARNETPLSEANDLDLLIRLVTPDGESEGASCATGRPFVVDAGVLRFEVEAREPVSMKPWNVRLVEGTRVIQSWSFDAPTTVSLELPGGTRAYLSVAPIRYSDGAVAQLLGR